MAGNGFSENSPAQFLSRTKRVNWNMEQEDFSNDSL